MGFNHPPAPVSMWVQGVFWPLNHLYQVDARGSVLALQFKLCLLSPVRCSNEGWTLRKSNLLSPNSWVVSAGSFPVLDNFYFDFWFSPRSICRNEGEKSGVFEYIVAIIYKAKTTFWLINMSFILEQKKIPLEGYNSRQHYFQIIYNSSLAKMSASNNTIDKTPSPMFDI